MRPPTGVNLRAGYALPLDHLGRNTVSILPGIYAWSMFVPGNQYGVQNLNGPQLVLALSHEQGSRLGGFGMFQRGGGYFKFAVIDQGVALASPSNRELAVGASETIRFFALPRPLVFSADYSTLSFASDGFAMTLSTFSLSIGASLF